MEPGGFSVKPALRREKYPAIVPNGSMGVLSFVCVDLF